MKRQRIPAGMRIEALVDGRLAVEGATLPVRRGETSHPIRLSPTYLRSGLVAVDSDAAVRVRPLGERDIEAEDDVSHAHEAVHLDAREFSEVWLDGRLAYMRK
ncbi:MAG: hypothetical protein H7287_14275 [Thermoleophilia bacterium]|nr:hypothetical protein [Thermoleophilia bacterium]